MAGIAGGGKFAALLKSGKAEGGESKKFQRLEQKAMKGMKGKKPMPSKKPMPPMKPMMKKGGKIAQADAGALSGLY